MIQFEGIQNARDLGGTPLCDGRKVKSGLLLRTGHLGKASPSDLKRLENDFHVTKVFDFRADQEVMRLADKLVPGSEYIRTPIAPLNQHLYENFAIDPIGFIRSEAARMLIDDFYVSFLADPYCQKEYAVFLHGVVSAKGAVLMHCSQGKDRTGIAAALILNILGADRKTILEDYGASNLAFADEVAELTKIILSQGGDEDDLRVVLTLFGVSKSLFLQGLDYIDSHFGSMDGFITGPLGLSASDISILRQRYIED